MKDRHSAPVRRNADSGCIRLLGFDAAAADLVRGLDIRQIGSRLGRRGPQPDEPHYEADVRTLFPVGYREWVFLSSGLNTSYGAAPAMTSADTFGNTFAPVGAYRAFLKTGAWPDRTILILENRRATSQGSINRDGQFQTTEFTGVGAHVKDTAHFKGGWGFFAFDTDGKPARQIPYAAACYACHEQHAAADTTFVQFYPTLLPVAEANGTSSTTYVAEMAEAAAKQDGVRQDRPPETPTPRRSS